MKRINKSILVVLAGCVLSGAASAENWNFDPRVEVGGQADDNYRLLPAGFHNSVTGAYADARFDITNIGPVGRFRFTPGVHATYFPNSQDDQSTDPYAEFEAARQGLRSAANILATYVKQSVVNSDRIGGGVGGGLGDPGAGDSGYIALRNKRELFTVTPNFTHDIGQRDRIELNLAYANASYERYIPGTNVGYSQAGGRLGYIHALTERHSFTVRGTFQRTEPDRVPGATTRNGITSSYGVQGEWNMKVSDLSQAYVRLGGLHSKFNRINNVGGSDTQNTYVAGAGVNWSFQVTRLFIDLTRTVEPSSTGFTVERNQLRFRATRDFTPLVQGFVSVRALSDRAADNRSTFRDRDYVVGGIGLEKRIGREWAVRGEYDYTRQKYENDPGPGVSNAVLISVVYEPHRETQSVGRFRR